MEMVYVELSDLVAWMQIGDTRFINTKCDYDPDNVTLWRLTKDGEFVRSEKEDICEQKS